LAVKAPRLASFLGHQNGSIYLWPSRQPADPAVRTAHMKAVLGDPAIRAKLSAASVTSLASRHPTRETIALVQAYLEEQRGRLDPEAAKQVESWIASARKKAGGDPD